MKVACPKCRKVIKAPDEWAGRRVKCPQCNASVALPRERSETEQDLDFDLASLGSIEQAGEALVFERRAKPLTLKEAQAAAVVTEEKVKPRDPSIRVCPQCRKEVRCDDPYCEILCRHCGTGIPGLELGGDRSGAYRANPVNVRPPVTFYGGFTGAAFYPLPAIGSIAAGMGIALGIIALPLTGVLAVLSASALNTAVETKPDLTWVSVFISVAFVAEAVYFGSVCFYALIDTVRSTVNGNDHPPNLTWNITKVGAALGAYAGLVCFYVLVALALLVLSGGAVPPSAQDLGLLGKPLNVTILALLMFTLPMNMIGLAGSHMADGLHPTKVGLSILHVIGHYFFLFLISIIYFSIYVGLMYAVMTWAGPRIATAMREGVGQGYLNLIGGVVAWAVVMGLGFYFAYMIGRILGLFARTYRENFAFEE